MHFCRDFPLLEFMCFFPPLDLVKFYPSLSFPPFETHFNPLFKNNKIAIKRTNEKSKKKYLEDNEISKLNLGGESCTVLRLRLMRKLAMCHMNFMSQI